jgi:hypothetical protein
MSIFIGPLFPDELAWNLPGRIQERYPELSIRSLADFFGSQSPSVSKLFPTKLAAMAAAMKFPQAPSAEDIARHHTFYPFSAILSKPAWAVRMLHSLTNSDRPIRGPRAVRSPADTGIRVCLHCMEADRAKYGFAYPHRLHQVPSLRRCHLHDEPLHLTDLLWDESKWPVLFQARISPTPMPCASEEIQGLLGRAHECIAHCTGALPLQVALFRAVADLLIAAKLTNGSPESADGIAALLEEKFGRETLLDVGLESTAAVTLAVTAILARGVSKAAGVEIPHLALLASLAGSDFATAFQAAVQPLAQTGPWPCVATGTECSGKRLIFVCETRRKKDGAHGRFRCPECATVYHRPMPLRDNPDGSFDHQVTTNRVPPPWTERLRTLWLQPKQTWRSMMAELKVSRWRIQSVALHLGLPDMPRRRLPKVNKYPNQFQWAAKRTENRARLVAILQANPAAPCRQPVKSDQYLMEWFATYDPKFLESLRRSTHPQEKAARLAAISGRTDQHNAAVVAAKIGTVRERLLGDSRRITVTALLRGLAQAGHPVVVGPNHRQTAALLRRAAETREDHFQRQFACLKAALPPGPRPPKLHVLLRAHRLFDYYYSHRDPGFRAQVDRYLPGPGQDIRAA